MSCLISVLAFLSSLVAAQEPSAQLSQVGAPERSEPTKELVVQSGKPGVRFHPRPDGSLIATASSSGIQLWNSRGRILRTISHLGGVTSIALNPTHDLIAVSDTLLDLRGEPLLKLKVDGFSRGHGYTWSPDGEVLAVETTSSFNLFNLKGELLANVGEHQDALCFSPASALVYGAVEDDHSFDIQARVWDFSGKELRSFPLGQGTRIRSMTFSNDGRYLAVGLARNMGSEPEAGPLIRIFSPDGTWLRDLKSGTGSPGSLLAFGESGFLTTTGDDTELWTAEGELLQRIAGFWVNACTADMLIGSARGTNPRAIAGQYVHHFVDPRGQLLHELPLRKSDIHAVAVSPVSDLLASIDSSGLIRVWGFTGETLSSFLPLDNSGEALFEDWSRTPIAFGKDGRSLVVRVKELKPKREFLHRYSLSGELLKRQELPYGERSIPEWAAQWLGPGKTLPGVQSIPMPNGVHALDYGDWFGVRPLKDPSASRIEWGMKSAGYGMELLFSPDGQRLYTLQSGKLTIRDGITGMEISKAQVDPGAYQLAISPTGKVLAYTGANERDGTVTLIDAQGKKLKELAHPGIQSLNGIRGPLFTHDGRGIVTGGSDGSVRVWLWETDEAVNWLFRGDQWIMYTDKGLFDGSRGGGELLGMTSGRESFSVDQFALRFNRPDLMLEILGSGGEPGSEGGSSGDAEGGRGLTVVGKQAARRTRTLVEHYHGQYLRRLRKAGLTEEDLQAPLHAPTLTAELLQVEGELANLRVIAEDRLYPLGKLFTWVNGVPAGEQSVQGQRYEGALQVALGAGENRIEVSVLNSRGAESLRALVNVRQNKAVKPALHVVSLGVSDYQDDALDLAYAHKDSQDLALQLAKNAKGKYSEVVTYMLVNEDVTQDMIQQLLEPLGKLDVNDTLLLFVAGHGVHDSDSESTWYFLTHEANLDDLAGSAVPFELLEDLLAKSPARHKLFLMDACESGELEEDWLALASPPGNMRARTSKKLTQRSGASEGRAAVRSIDRNRYIFYDLLRRSGAIVYSSSRGSEFSYEDPAIQNGWFTEKVLEALTGKADRDQDGWVDTYELRQYVTPRVADETGGRQHPSVDRDNVHQTVRLPVGN